MSQTKGVKEEAAGEGARASGWERTPASSREKPPAKEKERRRNREGI
ncbi:MAG: hypothetical protein GX036_09910 [Firmicutes bacterium]|nr:hypothetical protein [Bacillota bacterium]